jgi:hypothetical protein
VLAERLQKPFKLPRTTFVGAYSTITTTDNTTSTIPDDDSTYLLWEDDISIMYQSWAQPCQLQPDILTFALPDFPDILTFALPDFPDITHDHHVKSTFLVEDMTRSIPDHFASADHNAELTFNYADVTINDTDKPTHLRSHCHFDDGSSIAIIDLKIAELLNANLRRILDVRVHGIDSERTYRHATTLQLTFVGEII